MLFKVGLDLFLFFNAHQDNKQTITGQIKKIDNDLNDNWTNYKRNFIKTSKNPITIEPSTNEHEQMSKWQLMKPQMSK